MVASVGRSVRLAMDDVPAYLLEQEQRYAARTEVAKLTKEQTAHSKEVNRLADQFEAYCKEAAPLLLRLLNEGNGLVVPLAQRHEGLVVCWPKNGVNQDVLARFIWRQYDCSRGSLGHAKAGIRCMAKLERNVRVAALRRCSWDSAARRRLVVVSTGEVSFS